MTVPSAGYPKVVADQQAPGAMVWIQPVNTMAMGSLAHLSSKVGFLHDHVVCGISCCLLLSVSVTLCGVADYNPDNLWVLTGNRPSGLYCFVYYHPDCYE